MINLFQKIINLNSMLKKYINVDNIFYHKFKENK